MDRKIKKKTWTWQRIVLGAVVIAVLGYLGKNIMSSAGTSRLNVQSERLLLDTVKVGNFQDFIPVTGVVLPIKTVLIGAIEGGRVDAKYIEDGTMVSAGQPILKLSNPDLQLNYLNQEANIVNQINQIRNTSLMMEQQSLNLRQIDIDANFRYELVSKRLERYKSLHKGGVISSVDLQETEDEFNSLEIRKRLLKNTILKDSLSGALQQTQMEASLDLMQRNLKIARQSLDNLIIKAPIAGQLSGLTSELGELIIEGSQIAQIDDLNQFKIRVNIDEFYISRVYTGLQGSLTFANEVYTIEIQKIFPQVTNGTFEADMLFVNTQPEGIKRGQTFSVKLELSAQQEALLVKKGSFFQTTGGNWIYVMDKAGNVATKKNIRVGRQNPNYYEVLDGLITGDVAIISSYENFGEKDELILK